MDSLVLAFGHKARMGKDTAVQAIIDKYSEKYDVRRFGFADVLKIEVNKSAEQAGGMLGLFSILPTIALQQTSKPLPEWVRYDANPDMTDPFCPLGKQRPLLQWWGTEFRRNRDPFYWVKKMRNRIEAEKPQVALISDMRFLNEAAYTKSCDYGFTIRLERTGFSSLISSAEQAHASECELDRLAYDYVIEAGDGDVAEVRKCAVWVFEDILDHLRATTMKPGAGELWHLATPDGTEEVDFETAKRALSS